MCRVGWRVGDQVEDGERDEESGETRLWRYGWDGWPSLFKKMSFLNRQYGNTRGKNLSEWFSYRCFF